MAFEKELDIEISHAEAEKLGTPRDVHAMVVAKHADRGMPTDSGAIFSKIRGITVSHLNVRAEDVTPDARFMEDLGAD
jgi:acyl carrier protein